MTIWRAVAEGSLIPRGYGIAWVEPLWARAWCLPIPLNLIAGFCRRMYHWAISRTQASVIDRARAQGYRAGRWRTLSYAHEEAERIAERMIRLWAIEQAYAKPKDGPSV